MTIQQSWSGSGMTIHRGAPSKASRVRLATPYLEVETRPTSSAERAIGQEQAQVRQGALPLGLRLAPALVLHAHMSPFLNRSAMCSAVRAASAMIVWVGFFSDADGNTLPSTT